MSLEHFYEMDKTTEVLIPTDGGRYDVNIPKRVKTPVYWKDGLNDEMEVRRASWFSKAGKGQLIKPLITVHTGAETIQGRKLFAEIGYSCAQPKNEHMSLYMCMLIRKTLGITLRSDTYSRNVSAKITFF